MRATVVSFMPVAHGRSESPAKSAAVEGGEANILWLVMIVPKMQQAYPPMPIFLHIGYFPPEAVPGGYRPSPALSAPQLESDPSAST